MNSRINRQGVFLVSRIILRHWTVYRKHLLANISPVLADPVFILLALGMGLSGFVSKIGDQSYSEFLGPGLVGISVLLSSFFEASYVTYFRLFVDQNYKAMMTTPIGPHEVIAAEYSWLGLKSIVFSGFTTVILVLFGVASPLSILPVALVGGFLALSCGAIGLLSTTLVKNLDQFQTAYSFVVSPLFFLSGVFFPVSKINTPIIYWVNQINPLYHGIRIFQEIIWKTWSIQEMLYHFAVLCVISVVLVAWSWKRMHTKLWL